MGNPKTTAQAKLELEELYSGIPDDSVNLTFQDLANVKSDTKSTEKKKATTMEAIQESKNVLNRMPSLDFNRGLQASKPYAVNDDGLGSVKRSLKEIGHRHHHHNNHLHHHNDVEDMDDSLDQNHVDGNHATGTKSNAEFRHTLENSVVMYDDASVMSTASMYSDKAGKSRRPGIPHSNICTVCSTYIYIFRQRCLVCGRAYCRTCVGSGMGDMPEGRKCFECLGKRFSQRYIERAGKISCWSSYPKTVKQAELKWAEKGPRRGGEGRATANMSTPSRPKSPMIPRSPAANYNWSQAQPNTSPSFVHASPYSPHSPAYRHSIPL
ncbi:hypothetical protein K2173_023693 [Erythroxylum novogranatense]|uniref:Uncharacterized protein n=1 Tax=Erythroxylum novogranatense TaxID=1862640 RepID=A0AAV8TRQ1_9ROSI|nr:hypothetical protein K2173_023693 [Erythroxylum novogranatense]